MPEQKTNRRPGLMTHVPTRLILVFTLLIQSIAFLIIITKYKNEFISSSYNDNDSLSDISFSAAVFDGRIRLNGMDLSSYSISSGGVFDATFLWEILQPSYPGTSAYLHIFLPNKEIIPYYIEFYPQPTDRFYVSTAKLTIPADMKPGEYKMGVGLYVAEKKYKYWREDLLDCYYRLKQPLKVNAPINTSTSAAPPPS